MNPLTALLRLVQPRAAPSNHSLVTGRADPTHEHVEQDSRQHGCALRSRGGHDRHRDARMACRRGQGEHCSVLLIGPAEHMADGEIMITIKPK